MFATASLSNSFSYLPTPEIGIFILRTLWLLAIRVWLKMGYYQILHGLSPCPHWNGGWRVKSFRHAQISYQSSWIVLSHGIYEISHKHQMFPIYTMIEDYMYWYYTVGCRWILTESRSLAPALPSVQWYRPWPVGPHLHLKAPAGPQGWQIMWYRHAPLPCIHIQICLNMSAHSSHAHIHITIYT